MTQVPPARADPEAPPALRDGLDALAGLDPQYDVAAGAARFEATLGKGPPPSGPGTASGSVSGTPGLTLVIAAALVVGVGAAWWGLAGPGDGEDAAATAAADAPHPGPREVVAETSQEAGEDVEPAPGPSEPDTIDSPAAAQPRPVERSLDATKPPPVGDADSERAHRKGRTGRAAAPSAPASDPAKSRTAAATGDQADDGDADRFVAEMKALNEARKHVKAGRGAAGLRAVSAARKAFPERRFDEEWQALEILSLAAAGRTADAQRLGDPYLHRHPGGRFNASIEHAIAPEAVPEEKK